MAKDNELIGQAGAQQAHKGFPLLVVSGIQDRAQLERMYPKGGDGKSTLAGSLPGTSGKGKSSLTAAQRETEVMLKEYRHALIDGLGSADGKAFELACLQYLGDNKNVGVAWMASQQRVYLLFEGAARPEPEYQPLWLLDMAKELTLFLRTFVVPDQTSAATTYWGGIEHGPIISYRFKLADSPVTLNI